MRFQLKPQLIFFLVSSLCFGSQSTWASPSQVPVESEAERLEIAQRHLREAIQLIKDKKLREAISELDLSFRAHESIKVRHLLAKVYDNLEDECARAIATWADLIDLCAKETCPLRTEILSKSKLADLECGGDLTVESEPSGVEVFIDDVPQGMTPLKMKLVGGLKKVVLYKSGYQSQMIDLALMRGWERHQLKVELTSLMGVRGDGGAAEKPREITPVINPSVETRSAAQPRAAATELTPSRRTPSIYRKPQFPSGFKPLERPMDQIPKIQEGRIAFSGGMSMMAELRCEYVTRFDRYLPHQHCERALLRPFDRYYLAVQSAQDLYLYVIMSNDQNGQWQLLYPLPGEDNFVTGGQLVSIPEREWVLFDEQFDITDHISIIGSPTPISSLEILRGMINQGEIPVELKRYFISMSAPISNQSSIEQLRKASENAMRRAEALHITFEVFR